MCLGETGINILILFHSVETPGKYGVGMHSAVSLQTGLKILLGGL